MLKWITVFVGLALVTFGMATVFSLVLLLCGVNQSQVKAEPTITIAKNLAAAAEPIDASP